MSDASSSAFAVFLSQQTAAYATPDGMTAIEAERTRTISVGPERMWAQDRRAFAEAEANRIIAERDGSRARAEADVARAEQERLDAIAELRRVPAYLNPDGRARMLADIVNLRHLDKGAAA